jgi:hypothetical protein
LGRRIAASPLTVPGPAASPTLVLVAEAGIEPQVCLPEGTVLERPFAVLAGNAYSIGPDQRVTLTAKSSEGSLTIWLISFTSRASSGGCTW